MNIRPFHISRSYVIKQLEEAIALFDKSVADDEAIGVRNKLRGVVEQLETAAEQASAAEKKIRATPTWKTFQRVL